MAVSEAQKKASEKYKKENMKQYKLMLSLKYDTDIITMLDSVENRQGYLKSLIRADIARANSEKTKEEETMMKYTIKPEYLDLWGSEADENTIITEEDVARFARDWETSEDELKSQLIPVRAKSISLDNGHTFITAAEAMPEITARNLWDAVVELMDDDTRETVTSEGHDNEGSFLARYLELAPENLIIG